MLRNGEQLLLAIVIPVIVLVGGVAGADRIGLDLDGHRPVDVLAPGVLALAVMSTAFTSVAIATGFERRYGVIKRLGSSPLPRHGLLLGKVLALLNVVAAPARRAGRRRTRPRLGALAGRPGRDRRSAPRSPSRSAPLRSPRSASSWPVCCAPRRPWPWPTSSTCSSWPAAAWCCRPRRTARCPAPCQWLPSAALGDAMRAALIDGRGSTSPPCSSSSSGPCIGTLLTARTFKWE